MNDLQSLAYDVINGYIMAYHREGLLRPLDEMDDTEVLLVIENIILDSKEQLYGTFDDKTIGKMVEKLFHGYCMAHNLF